MIFKKRLSIIVILIVLFWNAGLSMAASTQTKWVFVKINNITFSSTVGEHEPFVNKAGRVMVPIRIITYFPKPYALTIDDLNQNFERWTVDVNTTSVKLSVAVGNPTLYVNGTTKKMDTSPERVRESVFVPVRAISEAFGAKVSFNHHTKQVDIFMKP